MMDKECEIEHFGFSAEHASIERKYFIKKILNAAFDVVLNKIDCSQETSEHLVKLKEDVFQDIWVSIGSHVKAADDLDKKYFSVPDNVLLPTYFDHVNPYTESDEKRIDEQVALHRTTFLENSIMLASLKMENGQYTSFVPFVDDELYVQLLLKESFKSLNMKEIYDLVDKTIAFGNVQK